MLPKKDDSFRDFILDQLNGLGAVSCRTMFGGCGLYHEQQFFGIIFKGRLYFKTDPSTQTQYRDQGMKPFRPSARQMLKNYFEVPADMIEDPDVLVNWAEQAARTARPTR